MDNEKKGAQIRDVKWDDFDQFSNELEMNSMSSIGQFISIFKFVSLALFDVM